MSHPEISVCVPSHDRPVRLLWLLNALQEQTLAAERFEVVVAHDSRGPETEEILRTHPLATAGTLRHLSFEPGSAGPAAKRNAAWKAARTPHVVFTDDDCRPPAEWLERALAAARAHPDAVVQGTTLPDPDEAGLLAVAPFVLTQNITPPTPWAQTCNITYPRALLERLGGFDERFPVAAGEDTDLAVRAVQAGATHVGTPEVVSYHAVQPAGLRERLRNVWRWGDLAYVVKAHPHLRDDLPLWIFWKRTHALLPFAVLGLLLFPRHRLAPVLAVPWLLHAPFHGGHPRGRIRTLTEIPGRAVVDAAEMATLARGSIRHRTFLL